MESQVWSQRPCTWPLPTISIRWMNEWLCGQKGCYNTPKRGDTRVPRIHRMCGQTKARRGRQRKCSHFPHDVMFAKRSLGRGKELEVAVLWKGKYKFMTNASSWVDKYMMWRKSTELLVRLLPWRKPWATGCHGQGGVQSQICGLGMHNLPSLSLCFLTCNYCPDGSH